MKKDGRDSEVRSKLISYSIIGGVGITALAIALRMHGASKPALYLAYPGVYLMQSFLQGFLDWLPGGLGMNLIAETFTFILANTASYTLVIFLLLRIFIPDRSEDLPSIVGEE
jgi:hypothetical protein